MNPHEFYKLLADETRLKCLCLLFKEKELCVCELMETLDISQPKVSRHLAELRKLALVEGDRRGKWIHYRIHPNIDQWMMGVIELTANANPYFCQTQDKTVKEKSCDQ